jgi:hypothetical protein
MDNLKWQQCAIETLPGTGPSAEIATESDSGTDGLPYCTRLKGSLTAEQIGQDFVNAHPALNYGPDRTYVVTVHNEMGDSTSQPFTVTGAAGTRRLIMQEKALSAEAGI